MIGLLFILAAGIYLGISILVVYLAVRLARRRNIAGWKLGVPASMVMFLILFWDYLPTVVAHKYYCDNEAGFRVYKTPDQWRTENPDIEVNFTNGHTLQSIQTNEKIVHPLNTRFQSVFERERIFLSVKRANNYVLDVTKNEVLARYVDFSSGQGGGGVSVSSFQDVKFWLSARACNEDMKHRKQFGGFVNELKKL